MSMVIKTTFNKTIDAVHIEKIVDEVNNAIYFRYWTDRGQIGLLHPDEIESIDIEENLK